MSLIQKRLVSFAGAMHLFVVLENTADQQGIRNSLNVLKEELERNDFRIDSVVKLTFFLVEGVSIKEAVFELRNVFSGHYPSCEFLIQPPLTKASLTLFAWAVLGEEVLIEYPQDNQSFLRQADLELLFVGNSSSSGIVTDFQAQFAACFKEFESDLQSIGYAYSNLAKTWTYCGNIRTTEDDLTLFQHFNTVRTAFYQAIHFDKYQVLTGQRRYPANTGVGNGDGRIGLSGIACNVAKGISMVPLDNPIQLPPCQNSPWHDTRPLLFSQGMAVVGSSEVLVLLSGTGSVVGGNIVEIGSAARQTERILDLLDTLLSTNNIANTGLNIIEGGLSKLVYCVVYVEEPHNYQAVRKVCEKRLSSDLPVAYVQASLCSSNLLVEIDGLAIMQQKTVEQ